jgi:hypothetical protein
MIFLCSSDQPVAPRVLNPFSLEAADIERARALLVEWLGPEIAARVTVTPVLEEDEAVFVDHLPALLKTQAC